MDQPADIFIIANVNVLLLLTVCLFICSLLLRQLANTTLWCLFRSESHNRDMGSLTDIGVSAGLNILSAVGFLLAFAVLRIQPINDRVYFPKWYLKGTRSSPRQLGTVFSKFVNADLSTYIRFLNWMPAALKMPEPELIEHAGLDSAVYVRIYLLGWAWYSSFSIFTLHDCF